MRVSLLASVVVFMALFQPNEGSWYCWHINDCDIDCPQSGFPVHECKCTPESCQCCRWNDPGFRREVQTDKKRTNDGKEE
ncbi:hypothetical protein AAVH_32249 [Aphelenchoides avenae]|nr:hypothetical protein AAVH_32249 [Aphelenchus avenae]